LKVRFSPSARAQFLAGLAYIVSDKPGAARKLKARAQKILLRLKRFPDSGRKIPEFSQLVHREVVVPPYRFFYRLDGDTIWIVAVWHGAQIPRSPSQ